MRTSTFLAAMPLCGMCCFAQTAPSAAPAKPAAPNPAFTLTLAPPEGPFKLESPVTVNVTATNVSDKTIWWQWPRTTKDYGPYMVLGFRLTNNGREVETTFFNRKLTGRLRPDDPPEV
jgi:hypothetical protein